MSVPAATRNAVSEDANWASRLKKETRAANNFGYEWGFLAETTTRSVGRSVSPVKYHTGQASWTVKNIHVPEKKGQRPSLPQISPERLKQTPLRPSTALESVALSSCLRSEAIEKVNPFFVPTSSRYGARLSLEQFGISQFGIRASRTKQPSH